ncbi:DUF6542 domain-containing protein [Nocardioides sp. AE5]|uniref:DUF6542 domain-containing protein n=1 Tax=Nocardioides sp. AE5 TaxID=2962573 RepID=UPI002882AF51|nr:DUF6542 domain-containing protein [Nocardioides sp. AE5]MDT0202165.1 hypothetical protein [Nocardioides sp. AE5]
MARARTIWEEGTEPGRLVIALGIATALTAIVAELLVRGQLGWFFDIVFVVGCGIVALLVRRRDFFSIGLFPPLLMLGVFWLLAVTAPASIGNEDDSTLQALIAGLTQHAGALISGYALCLAILAIRRRVLAKRRRGPRSA